MKKLVVDSSVIVKWINTTDEQNLVEADKILREALDGKVELLAPELAKYEVGNVLLLKKKIPQSEIEIPLHILFISPIQFIPQSEELAKETFQVAGDSGMTYYDASFVSIAKHYKATLVTENIKHQSRQLEVKVVPLKDY